MYEVANIPYFNNQIARNILFYIETKGKINSYQELGKIPLFPIKKIEILKHYITLK